jgi:hypothetical protein
MKKMPKAVCLFLIFVAGACAKRANAETSGTEVLMKATTLTCMFTSEQQTRWGSGGPTKEEGVIKDKVTFLSINHKSGEAKISGRTRYDWEEHIPVRIRVFTHSITFFELTKAGELNPVLTTVLDDFYPGTTKFVAVRSAHVTSAFRRALSIQETGTCTPG